eukprot:Em0020g844a
MSLETLSHEEDNGEDPCQSIRPPSDDRERMLHLETAVAWIKQQVDALRNYDREILQDLWKVRSNIHDIRELQKQVMKDESRLLEDSMTASSEDGTLLNRSATPTAKQPLSNTATWRSTSSGPLADLPPPAHLLQPIRPPQGTESSTPIIVRKLMNLSNGGEVPAGVVVKEGEAVPTGKGAWSGKKEAESFKDEEMLGMAPQGNQVGVAEVKILGTTDVISDMQKLRLRLEEECRLELAAMDRQFQTRIHQVPESYFRPGSAPSQRKELQGAAPSHSRVSSDASDQSGSTGASHKRDYSLPVNLETQTPSPALTGPAVGDKAPHTPPQPSLQAPSSRHLPGQVLSAERAVAVAATNNNNNKGFSTPPPLRSPPAYQQPVFQSFRQNNHAPRAVQFARTSSGNVAQQQQQGLTQSCDFSSSDVPIQAGGTHYSTLVIKGKKKNHAPHSVSTDGAGSEQQQFGPSASGESPLYDRLGAHLVDQPEQKTVPLQLGNVQPSQQQQQTQLKLGASITARAPAYQELHLSGDAEVALEAGNEEQRSIHAGALAAPRGS